MNILTTFCKKKFPVKIGAENGNFDRCGMARSREQ
jgi:hypothetical protein